MRIVLVRLSALGDIVHTWPLAEAAGGGRRAEPPHHLGGGGIAAKRLVEGHPAVDTVLTVATRRWRRRPLSADTRSRLSILRSRFHELQPDLGHRSPGCPQVSLGDPPDGRARDESGLSRPWRREVLAGSGLHLHRGRQPGQQTRRGHQPRVGAGGRGHAARSHSQPRRRAGCCRQLAEPDADRGPGTGLRRPAPGCWTNRESGSRLEDLATVGALDRRQRACGLQSCGARVRKTVPERW